MSAANKEIGPPVIELGAMGWLRKNLFLIGIILYLQFWLIPTLHSNPSFSELDIFRCKFCWLNPR